MSHLVSNGEWSKTRRNRLRCSWTSASSAWVVFAEILGHSTNCKKLPLNFFLGGLVGLLFFWSCTMTLGSSSWQRDLSCTAAVQQPLFRRSFLEGTEKCTLNHCWSFPLGFLPRKTSANLRLAWEKSYASLKCLTIGRAHQSLWCQPITGSSTLLCREPAGCLHSQH